MRTHLGFYIYYLTCIKEKLDLRVYIEKKNCRNFFSKLFFLFVIKKRKFYIISLEMLLKCCFVMKNIKNLYKVYFAFCGFQKGFNAKLECLRFGWSMILAISGYHRRVKFSQQRCFIKLKVGKSHLDRFLIPQCLIIRLIARRLMRFFSPNIRLLYIFVKSLYLLYPADVYKGAGIRIYEKRLKLKKRYVKKI